MGLTLFVAVVVIGVLIFPLVGALFFTGDDEALTRGYRVRRVIGFAMVAAAVVITFLPVSSDRRYTGTWGYYQEQVRGVYVHLECGSGWQAMFASANNSEYQCGQAALPHLWLAGGVAAVGMGIAFWGAGRGRLVVAVCLPLVAALSVYIIGMVASGQLSYPAD